MNHYDRAWAEIDLDAVRFNIESIRNSIDRNTRIIAVIKADGYGHGALRIARLLEENDYVWGYAVATAEEAFALRDDAICKPILILGYTFPYSYERLVEDDIRSTVFMYDSAKMLSDIAVKCKKKCRVHIVRRHIVGGANRTLISAITSLRSCGIGTCCRLSSG